MARRLAFDAADKISLRTIVWVEGVVRISGKSVSALELEFRPPLPRGKAYRSRSYIWQKYKKGSVVPRSDIGLDGRHGLVERVDKKYPGTADLFNSPLWELCGGLPVGIDRIKEIYCGLPAKLRTQFIGNAEAKFWRKPYDPIEVSDRMVATKSLDGLIALACMIREAEAIQNPSLYEVALQAVTVRLAGVADCGMLNETVRSTLVERFNALYQDLKR